MPHPVQRRARVEAAGKRDADLLAGGKTLKNVTHAVVRSRVELVIVSYLVQLSLSTDSRSSASLLGPSIITARVSPSLYGCSRNFTFSARSFATHASRFGDAERDVIGEMAARADQRPLALPHVAAHRDVAEDDRGRRRAVHAVELERRPRLVGAARHLAVRLGARLRPAARRGVPAAPAR